MFEAYYLLRGYKSHKRIAKIVYVFSKPLSYYALFYYFLLSICLLFLIPDLFKYFDCLILFWRFFYGTVKHCDKF